MREHKWVCITVRLCVDVCSHKCMSGLMMVYDCGRENACVCAVIRMHLGVMKSCMFIRAHGCRASFVCVHDHESVSLVMKEYKSICGPEFL